MEERELNLRNGFSFLGLNRETQLKLLDLVTVRIAKIGLLFEEDKEYGKQSVDSTEEEVISNGF